MSTWAVQSGIYRATNLTYVNNDNNTLSVTVPGTPETWSGWQQVVASAALNYGIEYQFTFAAGEGANYAVQFGIGGGGSEIQFGPTLLYRVTPWQTPPFVGVLPIRFPQGSRLSVRFRTTGDLATQSLENMSASIALRTTLSPTAPMLYYGADVINLGANLLDTAVTVPSQYGGGAITELISSTSRAYRALQVVWLQSGYGLMTLFTGGVSDEQPLVERMPVSAHNNTFSHPAPVPCSIPAGTRLSMRMQSGTAVVQTRPLLYLYY